MAIFSTAGNVLNRCVENLRLAVNLIASQVGIAGGAGTASALTVRTVTASDSPEVTAVQVMDDWDESDRCKVNIIVGQAGVAAGAGDVGATVPRVTLAANDPAVVAVQVMDDWDESDRAKVNLIVGQAGVAAGAGDVGATVPRVTLAANDPAVVAVQVIDDWDESDRAKVNLIVGKAGIAAGAGAVGDTVPRVTVASDAPVVAHVEETLATVVNGTDGTYEYFLDLDGYRAWAVQFTLSGGSGTVTVTCEATLQDDGTAANACTYQAVTTDLFAVASATASGIWICDNVFPAKYVKIKVVAATGGANDADWTIYAKRLF